MYSLLTERQSLYQIISETFKLLKISPIICELGVHNAENAETLINIMQPQKAFFVDAWDSNSIIQNYSPFDELPNWITPITNFSSYFGGPIEDQETFDKLYLTAKKRLEKFPCAKIIKQQTSKAHIKLRELTQGLDYIYIDANHQYEFVLRDLIEYSQLLSNDGFIQLNDCVLSRPGAQQNLGVLRALHEFIARNPDFLVFAQTTGEWADVAIAKKNSISLQVFKKILYKSNLSFIRIPSHLVFNSSYESGRMDYTLGQD